jgi:hypothetical protein
MNAFLSTLSQKLEIKAGFLKSFPFGNPLHAHDFESSNTVTVSPNPEQNHQRTADTCDSVANQVHSERSRCHRPPAPTASSIFEITDFTVTVLVDTGHDSQPQTGGSITLAWRVGRPQSSIRAQLVFRSEIIGIKIMLFPTLLRKARESR